MNFKSYIYNKILLFDMKLFSQNAQGTIEYLVIISIIVIISLVVVGLVVNQTEQGGQVSSASQKISNMSSLIGINEAIIGEDSNALFSLRNNTGESITVTKISINGEDHNFDEQLYTVDSEAFVLNDVIACANSEQLYDIVITYTTAAGLEKTQSFSNVKLDCVPSVIPKQTFTEETVTTPSAPAQERFAYFNVDANFLNGFFNFTKLGSIKLNGELDWNTSADYTYLSFDYNRDMNGLVVYYKLNELNDSSQVIDYANYDDNATMNGIVTVNAKGLSDTNASYFPGDSSSHISFTAANLPQGDDSFTVMFWMNKAPDIFGSTILSWGNPGSNNEDFHLNINSTTDLQVCGWNNDFGGVVSDITGKWRHYAITHEEGTGSTIFYFDGSQNATSVRNYNLGNSGAWLGQRGDLGTAAFSAMLDEVKIYNRVLTSEEIQADYNKWFTDANYISPVIDTTSASTDFNLIKFNSNNGVDLNGHIYASQIEPGVELDLSSGLAGLWHFNETSGTTFADASGNGNDGSCTDCPTPETGLWDTNSQLFDGSNDVIEFQNTATEINLIGPPMTISAWIKSTNLSWPSQPSLIESQEIGGYKFMVQATGGVINFGKVGGTEVLSTDKISDMLWHHIVATYNSDNKVIFYIDGRADSGGPLSLSNTYSTGMTYKIGGARGQYWNGYIDEVAVWNRALDFNEVKELFNKGATKLGIKYKSCASADCSDGSWSDANYSAGTSIDISGLTSNRYFQWAAVLQQYQFPDGNYLPHAFATLHDVNFVYTN